VAWCGQGGRSEHRAQGLFAAGLSPVRLGLFYLQGRHFSFVCFVLRRGLTVLPRLAFNSWAQATLLPQPPEYLGPQVPLCIQEMSLRETRHKCPRSSLAALQSGFCFDFAFKLLRLSLQSRAL
jgi:hypothetical protein